jgi:hypothetical protein
VRFLVAVVFIASSASLFAQGTIFTPQLRDFKIRMPAAVRETVLSFAENGMSAQGHEFAGSADGVTVVVSKWILSGAMDKDKAGAFVRSLERAFQASTKSLVETPRHDQPIGRLRGGYTTLSFGNTKIGLWLTVRSDFTVYAVSFSAPRSQFQKVESLYLRSFELTS